MVFVLNVWIEKTTMSPVKWQTRIVSCFSPVTTNIGYALGNVEGRVAIQCVYPSALLMLISLTTFCVSYIEDKDARYVVDDIVPHLLCPEADCGDVSFKRELLVQMP
jgi:hypothetical protein